MIITLTGEGIETSIPITNVESSVEKWKELLLWIDKTSIPITVDKNYYRLRYALEDKNLRKLEQNMQLNLQFLTSEDKEIFLDKHMEIMWGDIV
jgi:hypothetical protein